MMNWEAGVNYCHDNISKSLPVIRDHVTESEFVKMLGRLPLHMDLCPVWLHLNLTDFNKFGEWHWLDNSHAGTQFTLHYVCYIFYGTQVTHLVTHGVPSP